VQRVVMPETEFESWTVLGDDQLPIEPVERFLAYLASIEKSPNTIKAYAHDLKDWFLYLAGHGRDWRSVTLEDVAGFVAWLRLPPQARDGAVAVLPAVAHHCSPASVNRKLAALTSLCGFHAHKHTRRRFRSRPQDPAPRSAGLVSTSDGTHQCRDSAHAASSEVGKVDLLRGRGNHLPGRRHGIAWAHFMCPSKPKDVALAR
jgi:hypothetical protein